MAKSIDEINAVNSVNKAQALAEVQKTKRAGGAKRKKASAAGTRSKGAVSGTPRKAKSNTAGTGRAGATSTTRAAQKRAQRTAARNLFAQDVSVAQDSFRSKNLADTSPLKTLAPGATLANAAPGSVPAWEFAPAALPLAYQQAVAPAARGGNVNIGQLYSALANTIGPTRAYAFCQQILNDRWQSFIAMAKAWQEDEAMNAKLAEQASIRAQQRNAEQKRAHEASQAQNAAALKNALATLEAKHASVQATKVRKQVRPRTVSAPVRVSSTVAPTSATGSSRVVAQSAMDTLDNTPVIGLALSAAPAAPASRPAPASPQERGVRQAKNLRQSPDADMI